MIAIACGCVAALLLVIVLGTGAYFLIFRDGDAPTTGTASTTSSASDPETPSGSTSVTPAEPTTDFEVIEAWETPSGDAEDLAEVLRTSPLVTGSISGPGSCELPETPVDPTAEQMQATLDAASSCLNGVWATASSDRGLPWSSPTVVVYEWPDIPASAACEAESFAEDSARVCFLDETIYWPLGFGAAEEAAVAAVTTDPADRSTMVLWELAYSYSLVAYWNSSVAFYYSTLVQTYEDAGENEKVEDADRRLVLSRACLASATSQILPESARVPAELQELLIDPATWTDTDVTAGAWAHWIEVGFGSDGDLAACSTWDPDAEDVR